MTPVTDPIEALAARRDEANVNRTLWQEHLQTNVKGGFKGNDYNVKKALELAPDLQKIVVFDEFSRRLIVDQPSPWDPKTSTRAWSDDDDFQLKVWLQGNRIPVQSTSVVNEAVRATARRYDSLLGYLDRLKWDGVKRVETWLSDYLGVEDGVYARAVGKKFLVSAVARGLEPGCQADHVLALEGPQGAGKSSAVRKLGGDWTKEDLSDLGTKDAIVELQGSWLVELSELAAVTRGEVEQVKAFISRRVDKFRAPYGRNTVEQPRRCVFVATTNDERWAKDPTGNRRFWPVRVGKIDLKSLERDRDQLWAEAVRLYRGGTKWHITEKNVLRIAEEEQTARIEDDPWTTVLRKSSVGAQIFGAEKRPIRTKDLLTAIGIGDEQMHGGHAKRVGGIMRRWGWTSHTDKSGGTREVWWFPDALGASEIAAWLSANAAKSGRK